MSATESAAWANDPRFIKEVQQAARYELIQHEAKALVKEKLAELEVVMPEGLTLATFLEKEVPPLEWRVHGLMATGHNVVFAAQYKAGKTTTVMNLMRALTDGQPFLGHDVLAPDGNVAFLNYELDERLTHEIVRKIGYKSPERAFIFNLRGRNFPLWAPAVQDKLTEWAVEHEIEVMVVDPAIRAISGLPGFAEPENSNAAVTQFTNALDEIKFESGIGELIVVHHTGRVSQTAETKSGYEHSRGATRWDDWPDVRWVLTRKNDERKFYADGRGVRSKEQTIIFDAETWEISAQEIAVEVDLSLDTMLAALNVGYMEEFPTNDQLLDRLRHVYQANEISMADVRKLVDEARAVGVLEQNTLGAGLVLVKHPELEAANDS